MITLMPTPRAPRHQRSVEFTAAVAAWLGLAAASSVALYFTAEQIDRFVTWLFESRSTLERERERLLGRVSEIDARLAEIAVLESEAETYAKLEHDDR